MNPLGQWLFSVIETNFNKAEQAIHAKYAKLSKPAPTVAVPTAEKKD